MNGNVGRELAILNDGDGDNRALISAMIRLAEYNERDRTNEARAPLERLLNHRSAEIRRYAAITLGKLGIKEALPSLISACEDPQVQGVALHAIRLIGSNAMSTIAAEALLNGSEEVQRRAIYALEESGNLNADVLEGLRRIADKRDGLPARMARRALDERSRNK